MIGELGKLGYKEVNLNLGCPSGTVVSKFRGSGFLAKPKELDEFLDRVFQKFAGTDMNLSIKTRIGRDEPEEFYQLMEIYNKYEMSELIIHPRTQKDYYKNTPNWKVFQDAVNISKNPVCYNGNIFTVQDYEKFTKEFPQIDKIMIGRGLICNPALVAEILGISQISKEILKEFHNRVYREFKEMYSGDKHILFRMKELWCYMICLFQDSDKHRKKIMKSKYLLEYEAAVDSIFRACEIDSSKVIL